MPNKTRRGAHQKKVSVAAYCSIIAAYWPKRLHIGFFIENCKKWVKNHYLEHFDLSLRSPLNSQDRYRRAQTNNRFEWII